MSTDPIASILATEGGFVNHKAERGGPTKFGICQREYSKYLGRKAAVQEVKDMTEATAREIYERHYYTGPRIHLLPEPPQALVLDMALQHGPLTAIRMLQRVVNAAGFGPVAVDGVLGPVSRDAIAAASTAMGRHLQNALVDERVRMLKSVVLRDETKKPMLDGWLLRAESFRKGPDKLDIGFSMNKLF